MPRKYVLIGLLLVILAGLSAFTACDGTGSSPSDVVKNYYKAINDGNFEKAKSYTAVTSYYFPVPEELKGNIEELEIVRVETSGGDAAVEIKLTLSPAAYSQSFIWQRENRRVVNLSKTDQGWKIWIIN
jgi:hypothetical protein